MSLKIDQSLQQLLFAIAYKMTGEIALSQDISQEAIRKFLSPKRNLKLIKNPRAYLIKTTIHTTIDALNQRKKERELYIGTWLPEPILQPEIIAESHLDLNYGMVVMLSKLTPKERAIFILKEAFDYSYLELAELLDLTTANCRKIFQRLQAKLRQKKRPITTQNSTKKRIIQAFMHATETGQMEALIAVLKEDIALYSDGGGKVSAARNVLHGIHVCSQFLLGIYNKLPTTPEFVITSVNNEIGFLTYVDGQLISVGIIEIEDQQVSQLYFMRNPDKIHLPQ